MFDITFLSPSMWRREGGALLGKERNKALKARLKGQITTGE
jgi:hypothetical protein